MPGVRWGRFEELFTPAYWVSQLWMRSVALAPQTHRLGETLQEEVAACIVGGYGIPAEVGLAAFTRLKETGLLAEPGIKENDFLCALQQPLVLKNKTIRYRFAKQKARYLHGTLEKLWSDSPPNDSDQTFRNWLLQLPGIGLKTASWITRNWLDSDQVAVIDIHIHRAGILAGFFSRTDYVQSDYLSMEEKYLNFARGIGVRPSILDAFIWLDMKMAGPLARSMVDEKPRSTGKAARRDISVCHMARSSA